MNAIKTVRKLLQADPGSDSSKTLASLVLALESESDSHFQLSSLYELDLKNFELAMAILQEWRIDRYFAKKARLLDASKAVHAKGPADLHATDTPAA
ncbi:hypothetical protein GT347_17800 [Xylophilus rhododendri]|uniref:Uncharacterized protein n=1 Tax=Xylophilus rhododendri TaxID=2697032 RepID=A0A857J750_9BURK|nr:hypothetical protein [Xylophilus rhododendri]QHI99666.1 hypothetical protein GT347_17800 [Xylophilus rhododendri]